MQQKKRTLGRGLADLGLSELLGETKTPVNASVTPTDANLQTIAVQKLQPGRYQPRRHIDSEQLAELADSIRAQGLIQPIVVRAISNDRYEIVAGERRWRAAQLAGLTEVPAIVRTLDDKTTLAISLIENIQRQELNVIEEAVALQRLIDEFGMTHQAVADAVGKSRATVTNTLRLLKLTSAVRQLVEEGKLEMGHARALLALEGRAQTDLAERIVQYQLSVRDAEELVRQQTASLVEGNPHAPQDTLKSMPAAKDADIARLERDLSDRLNTVVSIQHQANGHGKLVIRYHSVDELEGILEKIRS